MVKEFNSWVYTLIETPVRKRKEWVKGVLEGIKNFKVKNPSNNTQDMIDSLNSSSFDLVGFSTNINYIKDKKKPGDSKEDLEHVFVHAWGSPKLLYAHKDLPLLMIVGGDLRVDGTILSEIGKNKGKIPTGIRGLTS